MRFQIKKFVTLYIFVGLLGRLLLHPANFTPIDNLCLFSGAKLKRGAAILIMFAGLIISDILISVVRGYASFGIWSLFNYSAYLVMILAGSSLKNKSSFKILFSYTVCAAFGFWVWTNFGSWLFGFSGTVYPKNLVGFFNCYTAALPFLRNAILGNLAWMFIIFGLYQKIEEKISFLQKHPEIVSY